MDITIKITIEQGQDNYMLYCPEMAYEAPCKSSNLGNTIKALIDEYQDLLIDLDELQDKDNYQCGDST